MNTSTVNVKNNIISIALVSVNQTHFFEILSCKLYLKNPGQISSVLNSLQKSGELFLQVPCPLIFSGTVYLSLPDLPFYFRQIFLLKRISSGFPRCLTDFPELRLIYARSSDFLQYRKFYMLTGRKSGTHHIHLF